MNISYDEYSQVFRIIGKFCIISISIVLSVLLGTGTAIFRSFPLNACKFSFYRSTKDPMFSVALSTMEKRRKWKHTV